MTSTLHRLILLTLLGGCAHRVMLESDPPGATIKIGEEMVGVTPTELQVTWVPFQDNELQLKLPQRRSVTIDLQEDVSLLRITGEIMTFRWGRLLGNVPRTHHRAHFIRRHGPAGTWTPEEAK